MAKPTRTRPPRTLSKERQNELMESERARRAVLENQGGAKAPQKPKPAEPEATETDDANETEVSGDVS